MATAAIGNLYNKQGVIVGQAAGFVAAADTPLPVGFNTNRPDLGESITVFDPVVWNSSAVNANGATGGTFTLTLAGGPTGTSGTTAAIAFGANAAAVAAAIQLLLTATGYTAIVIGTGAVATPWVITITGPGSEDIVITSTSTLLTGGSATTPTITPPTWDPLGATDQGWQVVYNPTTQDINIEEQPTPVNQQVTTAVLQFVANLSEDTINNNKYALSGTVATTVADTTHFGKSTISLQSTLPVYAVILETVNKFGFPRRYYCPEMTCAANVGVNFRRAANNRLIPVTFTSICDMSQIQIVEITANHS